MRRPSTCAEVDQENRWVVGLLLGLKKAGPPWIASHAWRSQSSLGLVACLPAFCVRTCLRLRAARVWTWLLYRLVKTADRPQLLVFPGVRFQAQSSAASPVSSSGRTRPASFVGRAARTPVLCFGTLGSTAAFRPQAVSALHFPYSCRSR